MTKKNKGILNMCENYTFEGITDLGEVGTATCDNCGAPLRYVASLKSSKNKTYYVGTECAKTLAHANIDNYYSMDLAFKEFKKVAEARLFLEKGENVRLYGYKTQKHKIVIAGQKGKAIKKLSIQPIYDMFKQEDLSFVTNFIQEVYEKYKETIIYDWCFAYVFDHLDKLKAIQKTNT